MTEHNKTPSHSTRSNRRQRSKKRNQKHFADNPLNPPRNKQPPQFPIPKKHPPTHPANRTKQTNAFAMQPSPAQPRRKKEEIKVMESGIANVSVEKIGKGGGGGVERKQRTKTRKRKTNNSTLCTQPNPKTKKSSRVEPKSSSTWQSAPASKSASQTPESKNCTRPAPPSPTWTWTWRRCTRHGPTMPPLERRRGKIEVEAGARGARMWVTRSWCLVGWLAAPRWEARRGVYVDVDLR
ncbi:hypothetical protein IWZ01DRAFT_502983 [Phyllosticta capitalensis]